MQRVEIKAVLNDRPLIYVSSDLNDFEPLHHHIYFMEDKWWRKQKTKDGEKNNFLHFMKIIGQQEGKDKESKLGM